MKRSRDEHIFPGFPNEIVHLIIWGNAMVIPKLAQASKDMKRWLDEQPNLYFSLFKHNFKNEYCLLYDLLANESDVTTLFDQIQTGDEDDIFTRIVLASSCSVDDKFIEHHPVDADFVMNAPFSRLVQYYHPYAGTFEDDLTEELYDKFCFPWDALIIKHCQQDEKFASKMARLFNVALHPCGYPNASYYMQWQSQFRQLLCRMLRILDQCMTYNSEDTEEDFQDAAVERACLLREELIIFISARDHDELAEKLRWSEKSEEEAWGPEDENGERSMSFDVRTESFIGLLRSLPDAQLPARKDAASLYQWWREYVVPYLEKTPPVGCDDWVIEDDPRWHINEDVLYIDTIDEITYKKHVVSLFLAKKRKNGAGYDPELRALLHTYKQDYMKDKDISRLEQQCFRLLLFRLLKYPLRPQNYVSGATPINDRC